MKKCTKCKEVRELKYFSFRTDTNKYRNQCCFCHKGYHSKREDSQNKIKDLFLRGLKECSKCKEIKILEEFNNDKQTVTGKTSLCKVCINKKYTKDELRNFRYKQIYNISLEDYNNLYFSVNGKCQICSKSFEKLCIDHCHITNKIRGLLCNSCNQALGLFYDNVESLSNAIKYLNQGKLPITIPMQL